MVCEHQAKLIASFNDWFERQDTADEPWPSFDRWVREALNQFVHARRVRCFRAAEEGTRLVSLTTQLEEPLWPPSGLPGLILHVMQTGRAYVHCGRGNGQSVDRLADEWAAANTQTAGLKSGVPHWLLPVRVANRAVGLVLAGELPESAMRDEEGLATLGALLGLCWRHVSQGQELAVAERTDRTSGVLTWSDLSARAQRVLTDSASEGEPVVVLALAVEGIRRLDDSGHWALRNTLMRQIGRHMQAKLRSDDLVGRFSEDRFVAVLRRLDLALGQMIARKLLATVEATLGEQPVLQETVKIRCGLSDSGGEEFEAAVGRTFEALRLARLEGQNAPVALSKTQPEEKLACGGAV